MTANEGALLNIECLYLFFIVHVRCETMRTNCRQVQTP
jgi:hypothetical protein